MPKRVWPQRMREIGLLAVVVLLTAVALSPLLRADQPCTHDGGLHYYRIVAMRHALEDGLLVSRWVPDLAFGYGYPFFNYRAAVSYYLGLALYLTGLSLPQALNLVYVISLIAAAIGAFLLGRDLFGPAAGVVTAVAYVYAPYTLIDALVRGNMPESVALALFPLILWSFRRLLLSGKARYLLTSAGLLALLWLTHNISSLLFTPFLVLYLLVVWLARGRRDHLTATIAALALGIGLTAFFWAPAVLEKEDAQLYMSHSARNNDYHNNFIDLSEVLAPPEPADPALLNPPLRLPVGLGLAVLALLGTALALWRWRSSDRQMRVEERDAEELRRRERWASTIYFALSGLAMIFMSTRASLLVWESLPLIPFVQFPWRFVGRAVLPFSLLAGAFVAALFPDADRATRGTQHATRLPWLAVLIVAALLVLVALPYAYPPAGYCAAKARPNMLDLFAYERSTGLVGVDPLGSYFPVTVQRRPLGSPLEAQYAAILADPERADRPPVARFDVESLPEGAIIHRAEYTPNQARLEIETPSAVQARYLAFAFPGWRVLVDGQQTDILPSDPDGLITFSLPAGRHVVEVEWASTPIRAIATMVSLVALAGVAFVAYTAVRNHLARGIRSESLTRAESKVRPASPGTPSTFTSTAGGPDASSAGTGAVPWGPIVLLAVLALLLLGLKMVVVDRIDTPFRHSGLNADGTLRDVEIPFDVRLADGVRFLGYERSTDTMPADGTLHLALFWSAYTRPGNNYRSTVALIDSGGQLWSPKTAFPRRGYADMPPSPAWGDGRYAVEGFDVEPLPGTPPGRYDLLLTAFDRETLAPLSVLNEAGHVAGPNLTIGQVELNRPARSPGASDVPMDTRLEASLGPLSLVGVNLDREEAAPGDPTTITLFWQVPESDAQWAGDEGMADFWVHLALVDEQGTEAMGWKLPLARADWPTTQWEPGDLWRGQHVLRLPGALESGDYTWRLELYESTNPESRFPDSLVDLGKLRINAPERLWEAPPVQLPLQAKLGEQVMLLGANLEPANVATGTLEPGTTLTVTLVWQGQQEMETSYRVFLHLLQPDGSLLAQSDGEPAGWTRPTTGWAPGEVVMDQRVLEVPADAPPGRYSLVAGLYDPDTRQRLTLPDGTTVVLVTPLTVEEP